MVLAQLASWFQYLTDTFGYLGIFLVSFVGSATVILPLPSFAIIFAAGAVMNPWIVGMVAGFGAAFGELIGYAVGRGGEKIVEKKHGKWLDKGKFWFEKHGAFPILVLFAATPLPDDIVGILCGAIKYDIRKFFVATLIGKIFLNLALALGGFYGAQWVLGIFGI